MKRATGLLALALLAGCAAAEPGGARRPPNVVLLLVDNVGYGDLGCYGNRDVRTPHMDALAAQGVLCRDFYIGSPSCMPSRGALLTGRHPLRNGLNEQVWRIPSTAQAVLPIKETLLPAYLKSRGYVSGCFGKWNLGFAPGHRPTERGFDEFFGHASGNIHEFTYIYDGVYDLYRGTASARAEGYSTDLFTDAACDFIRRHRDRPFFAYVPFNAAHFPNPKNFAPGEPVVWQVPTDALTRLGYPPDEPDETKRYRAILSALDDGIGRVLRQIDDLGLREDTLVILLSDNGAFMLPKRGLGVASNAPLRDGGVTVWEGGLRVPCVIRWPGRLAAGSESRAPLVSMDLVALILGAAGAPRPADRTLDGRDPLAALQGKAPSSHPFLAWRWEKASALREGRWKIVRPADGAPWQLFDLSADLGETRDLAAGNPGETARLGRLFEGWDRDVRTW